MSFDYSSFVDLATNLIDTFGRSVTVRQRTATSDADIPSDVTITNTDTLVFAVKESFRTDQIDGQNILAQDCKYLVAASSLDSRPQPGWQVIDESIVYNVISVEPVEPGDTSIIYTLHCRV